MKLSDQKKAGNGSVENGLRVAYAIQNVGGIDFRRDVGDTVPVKYTLRGLRDAGHQARCFKLEEQSVIRFDDIDMLSEQSDAPLGISGTGSFKFFEKVVRHLQKLSPVPYFAFFDLYRFYEACYRSLANYDVCHEHNGLFCAGAALASKQLNVPYVLTVSAEPLFERELGGRPLKGLHRWVAAKEAEFTYRAADKIICVSEPAKRDLVRNWGVDADKIVVMPNGVDVNLFHPGCDPKPVRKALGLENAPVIGFVGGFQAWHGLDLLIESFSHILEVIPQAKLLLVGDGRARPLVDRKIAECGVGAQVIITGFVPQEQVPEMLAAVDVAVIPYPQLPKELWFSPLKLYEYMAAGKAIVASRSGQIDEVLVDGCTGLLVEPGNVRRADHCYPRSPPKSGYRESHGVESQRASS